jgi:hypothetical protein
MTIKNILLILLNSLLLIACSSNKLDVNISNTSIKTKFINLDSIFVNSNKKDLISNHNFFKKRITDIYSYELGHCLQIGEISDTAFSNSITQFINDKAISKIENRVKIKFSDLESHKEEIRKALKHLKYHFPKGKIPENIVFMNSLFQSNAFCTEKEIGIGLERYLGNKVDVIKELPSEPFYDWIKESMNRDYLERDAICSWIITHYIEEKEGNLAENIIRWGKIIYLTEASFPKMEKNKIIRYSKEEYEWANKNEFAFWKYLIDEKMLFKSNEVDKVNLLNEAPFTIGLPDKSPDRLGQFLGWKIVQKYMSKNNINLKELIKIPYNTILQEYEIEN